MRTTDFTEATDKEGVDFRQPRPHRAQRMECGDLSPLSAGDLSPSNAAPHPRASDRALCAPWPGDKSPGPKAATSRRTPRRWRDSLPPSPIRVIREIRGFIRRALLLGALLRAGGAGAATLTVTNLADNGPGSLRQLIADASPDDTLDFAVTGTPLGGKPSQQPTLT